MIIFKIEFENNAVKTAELQPALFSKNVMFGPPKNNRLCV